MPTILLDSDVARDQQKTNVLIGRTIVAVEFPQDFKTFGDRWKHLVLTLDDGTVVDVSGQGHETHCVNIRIEMPSADGA